MSTTRATAAGPDVGFFVEAAKTSGSPVLEVGCGTGHSLIPIARAGLEVVGLELSPRMLAVCRERLLGEPDEVAG
jgi:ubiquinone/menaquinone biosynthesis C-methylase UbiE